MLVLPNVTKKIIGLFFFFFGEENNSTIEYNKSMIICDLVLSNVTLELSNVRKK